MNHPPDEILSALLDGEAVDVDDAAHVEDCPACQQRVAALRDVATALAEPVTAPAHLREASVAAALVETTGASGAIRRIAMARRSRAKAAATSARRVSAVSAAAVLVVALGVGGWLLTQSRGTADKTEHSTALRADTASTRSGVEDQAAAGAAGSGGDVRGDLAAAPAGSSTTHSYGYAAGEIGEYHDMHALADKARQDLAQSDATKAQHQADGSPCPLPPGSDQLWTAHVTYNGKDAAAWVRTTQTGRVLEVLDVHSACAVVESQAI